MRAISPSPRSAPGAARPARRAPRTPVRSGRPRLRPSRSSKRSRSAASAASASASSSRLRLEQRRLGLRPRPARTAGVRASASRVAMTPWSTNAPRSRSMPRRRSASSDDRPRAFSNSDSNWASESPRSSPPMAVSRASVARTAVSSPASSALTLALVGGRARSAAAPRRRGAVRRPVSSRPATWTRSACSSATTPPWRRAASAWRSSGRSWRRTSRSRSCSRVRLASVDASRRSLFSLRRAVLQHAGGLLDDRAPLLGPGVEHGVDLALADDHVLLATDAGVGRAAPGCRAAGTARR